MGRVVILSVILASLLLPFEVIMAIDYLTPHPPSFRIPEDNENAEDANHELYEIERSVQEEKAEGHYTDEEAYEAESAIEEVIFDYCWVSPLSNFCWQSFR